jgi:hypothetical protein
MSNTMLNANMRQGRGGGGVLVRPLIVYLIFVHPRSSYITIFCVDEFDHKGISQENAVWVNGKIFMLGKVAIEMPAMKETGLWKIRSVDGSCEVEDSVPVPGVCVDLVFTPKGARSEATNVLLARSDFVQPYGTFTGTARMPDGALLRINDVFGVTEDHIAVW